MQETLLQRGGVNFGYSQSGAAAVHVQPPGTATALRLRLPRTGPGGFRVQIPVANQKAENGLVAREPFLQLQDSRFPGFAWNRPDPAVIADPRGQGAEHTRGVQLFFHSVSDKNSQ